MNKRVELKYLVNRKNAMNFLNFLKSQRILIQDSHIDPQSGRYTIESLYYDTPDDECLMDSVEGYPVRKKIRIRHYRNEAHEIISRNILELKAKYHQYCTKVRSEQDYLPVSSIATFHIGDHIFPGPWIPTVVIEYERYPFIFSTDSDMRITLDVDVRSKTPNDFGTAYRGMPYLNNEYAILEIKGSNQNSMKSFQNHFRDHVETQSTRFSKYCLGVASFRPDISNDYWACYQNYLTKESFTGV